MKGFELRTGELGGLRLAKPVDGVAIAVDKEVGNVIRKELARLGKEAFLALGVDTSGGSFDGDSFSRGGNNGGGRLSVRPTREE